MLPDWLRESKRFRAPVDGWILCPTDAKIYDSMMPALRKWCPPSALKGGSFDKGWNGARNILSFACGSSLSFKTYQQDPSTLGGAELKFVGYDEPPPQGHREESRMRLMGGGFEMFAMTPLKSNTGYVRRVIWKQRESPDITVVKGSIHDNPTLDPKMIEAALGDMSDLWRRAREFGDFVDVGGLIYPEFERCVTPKPFDPQVRPVP
jgi:phage terminase large subunit-like protein